MLNATEYLATITSEAALAAHVARANLRVQTRTYPSWDVARLIAHLGEVHRWVRRMVVQLTPERIARPRLSELEDKLLPAWLIQGATELVEAFEAVDPTTPMWSIAPPHAVSFWQRRMALETLIHRWDIQDAVGDFTTIKDDLALEGIDEALEIYVPRFTGSITEPTLRRVILRCGTERKWRVTWGPTGNIRTNTCEAVAQDDSKPKADVIVSGTPCEIWLLLMGRLEMDKLDVYGDMRVASRFGQILAELPRAT